VVTHLQHKYAQVGGVVANNVEKREDASCTVLCGGPDATLDPDREGQEEAEIERRYGDAGGGPIFHTPVWGYGRHDPDPVMLRRDEIISMSATVDRGEQGVHLERPTPRHEVN
jgi:hypothetical protein